MDTGSAPSGAYAYNKKVPSIMKGLFLYGYEVPGVLVGVGGVPVVPPITIRTYISSPKNCPPAVDMRQLPRMAPVLFVGAVMATERLASAFAATVDGNVYVAPLIASPPVKANLKPASQAQEPAFFTFHVFVNVCPGVMGVLSGIVTSLTNLI